jgi:DNA-binding transcriptional MerR regulator/methylmalonyl-CoA mutase cobalamin-binding subunit
MYTIKQAGLRSGVSVPLLRAWERRYGIVEPARTSAGYRLYDDAAVDRLRTMRRLVDGGWTASEAARAIRAGTVPEEALNATTASAPLAPSSPAPGPWAEPSPASALIERFIDAARGMDTGRLEAVLDEAFAAGTFEHVAETIVLPALRALGDAWRDGTLGVAAEHSASHAVGRRLAAALAAAGRPPDGPGVLVGLPPGSRHELGAIAFATAARRAGIPLHYLGADLPAPSWLEAVERTAASAIVVAVPTDRDAESAAKVLETVAGQDHRIMLAVGGAGAPAVSTSLDVVRLPASVSAAALAVRDRLRPLRPPPLRPRTRPRKLRRT